MSSMRSLNTLDCPCGFARNIDADQPVCPVCGTDLTPLHRLRALPHLYYEQGLCHLREGQKARAIHSLQMALALKPGFDPARQELEQLQGPDPGPSRLLKSAAALAAGLVLGFRLFTGGKSRSPRGKEEKK